MDTRNPTLWIAALVCALAICLWPGAPAHAEQTTDVSSRILAGLKSKEEGALTEAIAESVEAHNSTDDKATRKKIQAALGKALKNKKGGLSRARAATALGQLNDPEGAWKQLAKTLPSPKENSASALHTEVLKAVAKLTPEKAVAPLLKLASKVKSPALLAEAATTLGAYGASKQRTKILGALLDVLQRRWEAAEAASRNPKGGNAGDAWRIVGEPLVAALNALTGQNLTDAQAWLAARKEHKKKLDGLFGDSTK